ncbi:MAG: nucleotide sugar dehydrogenase [Methanomassiliicoccales archaeon]
MKVNKVCVVGLGYVGLPLACLLAKKGFETFGLEKDERKVNLINQGELPFKGREPGLRELLLEVVTNGRLVAGNNPEVLTHADAVFICVDTPINDNRMPDTSSLESAIADVARRLRRDVLVCVESTLPPKTMNKKIIPILEALSDFRLGKDFYVVYSPERIMPGNAIESLLKNPRIIGSNDTDSSSIAVELYSSIVEAPIYTTDFLTAEIVKTVENAYRDVQIAFANEIALACEELGADVYEVRRLVNTSPHRSMHLPGSGVGGHCLTKDPWLLISSLEENSPRLIPTARSINNSMPKHLAALAIEALSEAGVEFDKAKITIFGLAFRGDIGDARNSPAFDVIDALANAGELIVHDPYADPIDRITFTRNVDDALIGSDCAIFVADHTEYARFDLERMSALMKTRIIVDGRNLFDARECRRKGFIYKGIGKGK